MDLEDTSQLLGEMRQAEATLRWLHERTEELVRELANERAKLATIVDHMPSGLIVVDSAGRMTFANRAAAEMGDPSAIDPDRPLAPQVVSAYRVRDAHTGEDLPSDESALAPTLAGETMEYQLFVQPPNASGDQVLKCVTAPIQNPDGTISGAIVVATNMTHEWELEQKVRRERDFVSVVLDLVDALVVVIDSDGRIVSFNRACEEMTGYAAQEAIGRVFWDTFIAPEDVEDVRRTLGQRGGSVSPDRRQHDWMTMGSGRRLISWSYAAIPDVSGRSDHIVVTGTDVTEQHQFEMALRAGEERYRAVVEGARDLIVLLSPAGQVLYASPSHLRILGYPGDSLVGRQITEWIDPADLAEFDAGLTAALHAKDEFTHLIHLRHAAGHWVPVEGNGNLVYDAGGDPFAVVWVMRDVTERLESEQKLLERERRLAQLQGVTLTAREMAHRLNNHYMLLLGSLDLIRADPRLSSSTREWVDKAVRGVIGAAEDLRKLQQVVRVETWETPVGQALDLDRSTGPAAS